MKKSYLQIYTKSSNVTSIMSIYIFRKHPGNHITFSDRSVLYGELKVMGSRPKVIFCVHGTRKCTIQDTLFTANNISE